MRTFLSILGWFGLGLAVLIYLDASDSSSFDGPSTSTQIKALIAAILGTVSLVGATLMKLLEKQHLERMAATVELAKILVATRAE